MSEGDNRDKGKGVVIEESGDGERADWVDWDRDDEDMRETEECVANSEDDSMEMKLLTMMRMMSALKRIGHEFDSEKNSDEKNAARAPVFCPSDTFDPRFALGMKFSYKKEFREAIHSHAIMTRKNLIITRNDKRRVYAKCKAKGFHVKNVRINWLSQRYMEVFRSDPNRSAKGFRQDIIRQLCYNVSKGQAYKIKRRCLQEIQRDGTEQYARIWGYADALRNKNPGSTIIMNLEDADATDKKKFKRFYVCFAAVKKGFLSGCRPFICVDGCHLKGPHGGVLLTAVGIPCNHVMSAISAQVLDSDDFVHECNHVETFCQVYAPAIMPLDGLEMWEKAGYIPPVPPNSGRKKGRLAKARRLEADEGRARNLQLKSTDCQDKEKK
ncbi:UNVERIFIED_CONTAM: hypothetical protein Slati_1364800 [Sesamum latifolium]|uniref:Transposase MuDR plant domain-containing protein n=1 Tax=Sesamum latifolium TaxID=2727402 RepID=A0AAW2XI67_9LAMI